MTADAASFDPYHKWLGIPPADQPADHYRLLGVALFEDDPDVIAVAADRQMAHVKSFATGPYAAHSQLLLNELSKARVCLLNPNLKPIYDAQLTKRRAQERAELINTLQHSRSPNSVAQSEAAPVPEVPLRPSDSMQELQSVTARVRSRTRRKRRRSSPLLSNFVILLVSAAVIGPLLWYARITAPEPEKGDMGQSTSPPMTEQRHSAADEERRAKDEQAVTAESIAAGTEVEGTGHSAEARREQDTRPDRPTAVAVNEDAGPDLPDDPFVDLPAAARLPELEAGPIEIGAINAVKWPLRSIGVDLLTPQYLSRVNRSLAAVRHRETSEEVRWLIFDEPQATLRVVQLEGDIDAGNPIAMLRATKDRLSFVWLPEAKERDKHKRLRLCLLRIHCHDMFHTMQLRRPVEDVEPIVIENWDTRYEHRILQDQFGGLPPIAEMRLRTSLIRGFPATKHVNGDPNGITADERLLLAFTSSTFAGLGVYWEAKGRLLQINVAPGFRLESDPEKLHILSRTRLESIEEQLLRSQRGAAAEYDRRIANRSILTRNLRHAQNRNVTIPGGGTTPQLLESRRQQIAQAEQQINRNEAEINALQRLAPTLERDVESRLPALRRLIQQLEGTAQIGFEFVLPVAGSEVVLYRKGFPAFGGSTGGDASETSP